MSFLDLTAAGPTGNKPAGPKGGYRKLDVFKAAVSVKTNLFLNLHSAPGRFQHQLIPSGGAHSHFPAEIIFHFTISRAYIFETIDIVISHPAGTLELHTLPDRDIVPGAIVADYRHCPGRIVRDIKTTEHRTFPRGTLHRYRNI